MENQQPMGEKSPQDKRKEFFNRLTAEYILEQTAIFKECLHDEIKLEPETVAEIKKRLRIWHKTWIETQLAEYLNQDYVSKREIENIFKWLSGESEKFEPEPQDEVRIPCGTEKKVSPFWWRRQLRDKLIKIGFYENKN